MTLGLIFALTIIQNAAFTWVSRSRNSADVAHHAVAALCSNSIWFVVTVLLWEQLWSSFESGSGLLLLGVVYVAGTVIGSCLMMALLLKTERGKRMEREHD